MDYRLLGGSGFSVPVLTMGTGTFGGSNEFFKAWGGSGVAEATRLVDICLEAGLTMFDSADVYSDGAAEEILGQAIKGRRDQVLISTKATFQHGPGPNDVGSSRYHLIKDVEGSLRRLGTDYIDQNQIVFVGPFEKMAKVLAHRVRCSLVPASTRRGLPRCQYLHKALGKMVELIVDGDIPVKRCAVELSKHVNLSQLRIQTIAKWYINYTIISGQWDCRHGPIVGQRE